MSRPWMAGGVKAGLGKPTSGGEDIAKVVIEERDPGVGQALQPVQGEL